ncbi:ATP-binding protein [Streptomyces sp. NPDC002055]|uniref:ATP-binding protein n=1 Tax=Streptomyces sp. NPDC002055 TaxID=3154534 RepID=UPI00332A2D71
MTGPGADGSPALTTWEAPMCTNTSLVSAAAVEEEAQIQRCFAVAFAPDEARVADMRQVTADHMRLWDLPGPLADHAVLAVSELVTNAIEHGTGAVDLRVRCSREDLRIEVTDESPVPAELRSVDDDALSGRGLFLIAVLSQAWGTSNGGRTTWCQFLLPAGRL